MESEGERQSIMVEPGDTIRLISENAVQLIRIEFQDSTSIEVTLAPNEKLTLKVGTTMKPEIYILEHDQKLGGLRAVKD